MPDLPPYVWLAIILYFMAYTAISAVKPVVVKTATVIEHAGESVGCGTVKLVTLGHKTCGHDAQD